MLPTQPKPPVIVIGAGPAGLTVALLLAQAGYAVSVYEAKKEIPLSEANSYPIGINPRGQHALHRIDPKLLTRLREQGEVVAGWHIYAGQRRVAKLPSGTVIATTRAFVNQILLEQALATPGIDIVLGHKLDRVDLATRTLRFRDAGSVDASEALVIAADGVWSPTRRSVAEQLADFVPKVGDWGVRFRVLFSQRGASAPGLDPAVHYIFGDKGLYTATLKHDLWCLALTARSGTPEEPWLLATEATPEHLSQLKDFVARYAPLAAPLFTDQDYLDFFERDAFSGAVVRCPALNVDEWLVLIGDAAHSVIPPTGEGINSGLEDCCYLVDQLLSGSPTPLADYNEARLPDLEALGEYAWFLMDNVRQADPARQATALVIRLAALLGKALKLNDGDVEAKLFGPQSDRTPYRVIFAPWIRRRDRLYPKVYPLMRGIVWLATKLRIRR